MKKLKNGCHFINIDHMLKFQITDPPPMFGSFCPKFLLRGQGPTNDILSACLVSTLIGHGNTRTLTAVIEFFELFALR